MSLDKRSIELGTEGWGVKEDNLLAFRKDRTRYVEKPFTFSRGTAATRVNSSGLIETLYDEATNLLLQSNQFDTTWSVDDVDTPTSGISGYDGTNNGWLLNISGDTTSQHIKQTISNSGVQTFSVYAKANTLDWMLLYVSTSTLTRGYFDIANGSLGSSNNLIDSKITDAGNGWYRCSITFNESITDARVYLANANNSIVQSSGSIYIQDAQLETGYFATPYIETTTQAVTQPNKHETPRISYDIVDGVVSDKPHLLLEPERRNLIDNSEYFNVWQNGGGTQTIIPNATTSPGGLQNASSIQIDSGYVYRQISGLSISSGDKYTWSCYVNSSSQKITLGGGTVVGTDVYSSENVGNGWYRQKITRTFTTSGTVVQPMFIDSISGTDLFYIWGAQVEEGSYATSYIPTNGETGGVTRAAETANNCGASQDFNDDEGVLYAEIATLANDGTDKAISISDGTFNNRIWIGYSTSAQRIYALGYDDGGSPQFALFKALTDETQFIKVACRYKENDFSLWVDGELIDADTSGTVSNAMSSLQFDLGNGSGGFYGKVKELKVYTETLNDAELRLLTKYAPKDYDTAFTADYVDSYAEFTVLRTEATDKLYYSISDGANSVSGSATITATEVTISNIDISSLNDGTLTLSVYIEDERKQRGVTVTDTTIKDTTNTPLYSYALQQRATGATFEDLDNAESIIESLNVEV